MSGPKVGDRVMVEFEAHVTHVDRSTNMLAIRYEDVDSFYRISGIPAEVCTVLSPPIKVGDRVTADVAKRLPHRSVIAPSDKTPAHKAGDNWICDGHGYTAAQAAYWDAVVLRIGGTS